MNFGEHFRSMAPRFPRLDVRCIYCPTRATVGCNDCRAPLCKKHAALEVDLYKCREHRKRLTVEATTKGELQNAESEGATSTTGNEEAATRT
jgi:hypothetical protein